MSPEDSIAVIAAERREWRKVVAGLRLLDGAMLQRAFSDTFQGGGWAEAPRWDDFDEDAQGRWEAAAGRLREIILQGDWS